MEASLQTNPYSAEAKAAGTQAEEEERYEEEAESNHEEQIESCFGTLLEEDPQSQETPQGGREEIRTQPWGLRTQSCLVE